MSGRSDFEDFLDDVIERHLRFMRGLGPEPDLAGLTPARRDAVRARLEIVDALAGRDAHLPSIVEDPVAIRLGLVGDRIDPGAPADAGSQVRRRIPAVAGYALAATQVLHEVESAFAGRMQIDWAPAWLGWRSDRLEPLARCSVLGDTLAVFATTTDVVDDLDVTGEPAELAVFLRHFPDVSGVSLVSDDASRAVMLDAASCHRAIDPVRGWLSPGSYVMTESFELSLRHYFQARLPHWDRVVGLGELIGLGDVLTTAREAVATAVAAALLTRPRLDYKQQAQQVLHEVDQLALADLIVAAQSGQLDAVDLPQRLLALIEASP